MLLFEVSWEVCNKVGGINTTITSKMSHAHNFFKNDYILIGPYTGRNDNFIEIKVCNKNLQKIHDKYGINCYMGSYFNINGPKVILIDYRGLLGKKLLEDISSFYSKDLFSESWSGIDAAFFGALSGFVINEISRYSKKRIVAHFHEWMCGSGLLYLKMCRSDIPTVFTTHATAFGRFLSKMDLNLVGINSIDEQAKALRIYTKHSLEKLTAASADCFTTVSSLVAKESELFYGVKPDVITPNGIDQSYFSFLHFDTNNKPDKSQLFSILENKTSFPVDKEAQLIIYSGRCEFRNKGLDVLIDALSKFDNDTERKVVFIGIILLQEPGLCCIVPPSYSFKSTKFNKGFNYSTTNAFLKLTMEFIERKFHNKTKKHVDYFFIPMFVHPDDGFLNMSYFDLLSIADLSIFPSNYEPWGYTPQESILCGVPTITTSKSGFGLWVKSNFSDTGIIHVLNRDGISDDEFVDNLKNKLNEVLSMDKEKLRQKRALSVDIVKRMSWDNFFDYYLKAYNIASIKCKKHD